MNPKIELETKPKRKKIIIWSVVISLIIISGIFIVLCQRGVIFNAPKPFHSPESTPILQATPEPTKTPQTIETHSVKVEAPQNFPIYYESVWYHEWSASDKPIVGIPALKSQVTKAVVTSKVRDNILKGIDATFGGLKANSVYEISTLNGIMQIRGMDYNGKHEYDYNADEYRKDGYSINACFDLKTGNAIPIAYMFTDGYDVENRLNALISLQLMGEESVRFKGIDISSTLYSLTYGGDMGAGKAYSALEVYIKTNDNVRKYIPVKISLAEFDGNIAAFKRFPIENAKAVISPGDGEFDTYDFIIDVYEPPFFKVGVNQTIDGVRYVGNVPSDSALQKNFMAEARWTAKSYPEAKVIFIEAMRTGNVYSARITATDELKKSDEINDYRMGEEYGRHYASFNSKGARLKVKDILSKKADFKAMMEMSGEEWFDDAPNEINFIVEPEYGLFIFNETFTIDMGIYSLNMSLEPLIPFDYLNLW
jgi:hypothetical protein